MEECGDGDSGPFRAPSAADAAASPTGPRVTRWRSHLGALPQQAQQSSTWRPHRAPLLQPDPVAEPLTPPSKSITRPFIAPC